MIQTDRKLKDVFLKTTIKVNTSVNDTPMLLMREKGRLSSYIIFLPASNSAV